MTDEQRDENLEKKPEKNPDRKPNTSRIVIWVVVGGLALYYIAKGLIGLAGH